MRNLPLHWKIIIGLIAGIAFGILAASMNFGEFVKDYIKPFGTIFINSLKLIALPLIVASLIKGIGELKDISKLSKMGGRTIGIYLMTTFLAVTLGLLLVNIVNPGDLVSDETRDLLMAEYADTATSKIDLANQQKGMGPLQPLIDLVPSNIFAAATSNKNMLQIIFFVIFFGIGLILIPEKKAKPVLDFFDGLNEVVLKMIDIIMLTAPYAVFALMATLIVESPSMDLFIALIGYALTVLAGLGIMIFVFYPTVVRLVTGKGYKEFFNGISPAQLLAFSTSSSAATLPVTMERTQEHLGVDEEVASFVLPIGATINMDGTSLYQSVAAVFVAQALGLDLSLAQQLGIIMTATLASIGTAAVPSAGIVMLIIVLEQAGIPAAGIALIIPIDRPLDMCRTVANVTSDATVSMVVAKSVGLLDTPKEKKWDDHYPKA